MLSSSLKKLNIEFLQFSTRLTLDGAVIQKIQESSPPDEDGDSEFLEQVPIGKDTQWVSAWFSRRTGKNECSIVFTCRQGKYRVPGRPRKRPSIPLPTELLDILSVVKDEFEFDCRMRLTYKTRKVRPIVNLPLRVSNHPHSLFTEIRGLHFCRKDQMNQSLDVIMDIVDNELQETMSFVRRSQIRESLFNDIINDAVVLNQGFVSLEK
jgi:hypothetical protein